MVGLEAIESNEILIKSLIKENYRKGRTECDKNVTLILEMKHVEEAIEKIDKAF